MMKKENRTIEIRIMVQQTMYDKLKEEAGVYRSISEVVREILAKYLETND